MISLSIQRRTKNTHHSLAAVRLAEHLKSRQPNESLLGSHNAADPLENTFVTGHDQSQTLPIGIFEPLAKNQLRESDCCSEKCASDEAIVSGNASPSDAAFERSSDSCSLGLLALSTATKKEDKWSHMDITRIG
jgi:hypothetical protein